MTQIQINKWEDEHKDEIVKWEIEYAEEYDIITFFLKNGLQIPFKRTHDFHLY